MKPPPSGAWRRSCWMRLTSCWGGMPRLWIYIRRSWIPPIAFWQWTLSRAGEPRLRPRSLALSLLPRCARSSATAPNSSCAEAHLGSQPIQIAMDLIEGRRAEVTPAQPGSVPSPKMRQVIGNGTQFILRGGAPGFATDSTPFGDTSRPSASLLLAPIRCQNRVLGVLTMQSYTPQAYAPEDLDVLQALADHCGGAIQRIQAEGSLRRTSKSSGA